MNYNVFKLIPILLFSGMMISCNNDDDSSEQMVETEFFPLSVGNYWVYKMYDTPNPETDELLFASIIDTVKIKGTTLVDDIQYFVKETKRYNSNILEEESTELIRVNESGHLVAEGGKVLHPGNDIAYTVSQEWMDFVLEYKLEQEFTWNFEGSTYAVMPYVGKPQNEDIVNHPYLEGKKVIYGYQEGIGEVYMSCPAVFGTYLYEMRLVDFHLN